MRHSWSRALGLMCAAVITLGLMLTGCGATSTVTAGQRAATVAASTAAAESTAFEEDTPLPTATMDPASVALAGCTVPPSLAPVQPQYVGVGGLNVSVPLIPPGLNYPSELMPNNEANAPYQIAASAVTNYQPNPPINPSLSEGYVLQVCNQSSASQTLSNINVTISSFTPSSSPVTLWHICQDGPYDAATKQTTSGCGGGIGGVDIVSATLPSDATGATAPVTGIGWPLMVAPDQSIAFDIRVNGLTSQGTYALSFGVSVDGAAPTQLAPSDGSFLIAPSAVVWTGTACQTTAMQALIPASSQDSYYVCPPAS